MGISDKTFQIKYNDNMFNDTAVYDDGFSEHAGNGGSSSGFFSSLSTTISPILIFIFCSIIFCGSQASIIADELKNLRKDHLDTKKKAIFELHKNGKKSIPLLIKEISDNTKVINQIQNPKYSFYGETHVFFGVFSAFVIELILGREKLKTENSLKSQFLLEMSDNYIYARGAIIDEENRRIINEGDLMKIKKIYADWWEKNKDKSIDQLRNDWKKNIKPLSGSKYHWE